MAVPAPQPRSGAARLFYIAALGALIIYAAHIGARILIPLVIAAFLAFLIVTLKNRIAEEHFVGRRLPGWVAFIAAFLTIIGGLMLLITVIRTNAEALIDAAPEYQARLRDIIRATEGAIEEFNIVENFLREQGWLGLGGEGEPFLTQLVSRIRFGAIFSQFASSIRDLVANLVVILLYTAFFLLERGSFSKKIAAIAASTNQEDAVNAVLEHISALIRNYLSIKTLTSLMTGAASYVVMLLIGVDFASFWAVLIFVLNFIPVIGSIVAVAFPVLLTAIQFGSWGPFLTALIGLTAIQQTVGGFIEPRMMGASLNLSPLVILLSLTLWGQLWGIPGMLLCVPIMVVVTITLSQFASTRPIAILLSQGGNVADISERKPTPSM